MTERELAERLNRNLTENITAMAELLEALQEMNRLLQQACEALNEGEEMTQ